MAHRFVDVCSPYARGRRDDNKSKHKKEQGAEQGLLSFFAQQRLSSPVQRVCALFGFLSLKYILFERGFCYAPFFLRRHGGGPWLDNDLHHTRIG